MSYLDKIHKKPVEYKISDNVDTKSEVDEAVENDIRERFAVHDVPMSYFEKNEDGKLSIKLGMQSRIAPGGVHEFTIDPDKVDVVPDNDRRSVDLYFKNFEEEKSATVLVDGRPRSVPVGSYVQDLRALVYKNRIQDSGKNRGREHDVNLFLDTEVPSSGVDYEM